MSTLVRCGVAATLLASSVVGAIPLNINDTDSIKQAAATIAYTLVSYYHGNESGQTPGLLPNPPYYWWESGGMFNTLIDYWYYTGDDTYNEITVQGVPFQAGPGNAFLPPNQTIDEGNDDQVFWAFTAMSAAEYNFPNPPAGQPQWLELAQGVFNTQAAIWDYATCGGGLRWQFNQLNQGYQLKTSAANGGFFNLAARLGAYTKNETYFQWANKAWDWMYAHGIISPEMIIYDSVSVVDNCTTLDHDHWTYTTGMIMNGAAVMWNQTQDDIWQNRTMQMWESCIPFYFVNDPPMVMREPCEPTNNCDTDQVSFKGYLSRFMAATTKVAPYMYDKFKPYLEASAIAAAAQCDGGPNQVDCGYHWSQESVWDGTGGVGQQIAALEVIQSNLIQQVTAPVSSKTGGTSKGNPNAGNGARPVAQSQLIVPTTRTDRIGAGVLTGVLVLLTLIGAWWIVGSSTKPMRAPIPKHARKAGVRPTVSMSEKKPVLVKRSRAG